MPCLKLLGKLRGPARLLAMSWATMEFDCTNGGKERSQQQAPPAQMLPRVTAVLQLPDGTQGADW